MCDYRIMLFSLGIVIYLLILCDKLTNVNHHALSGNTCNCRMCIQKYLSLSNSTVLLQKCRQATSTQNKDLFVICAWIILKSLNEIQDLKD